MKSIKVPKRYNYAEAYLTFRCNLGCSYCINKQTGLKKREELTAEQWAVALNRFDFGAISLTFGGGEPTMHPEFYELVKRLRVDIPLDLLTNLRFDPKEFARKISPDRFTKSQIPYYHPVRVSYHHESMDKQELVQKAKQLIGAGYNLAIFGIMHPNALTDNMQVAHMCGREGIPFYNKDFIGKVGGQMLGYFKYPDGVDGKRKNAKCRTREVLIGPDGFVHRCHRDLYLGENPIGNILEDGFCIEDVFRPCTNYGLCNPCDTKAKTNRFLKGLECQVEIEGDVMGLNKS